MIKKEFNSIDELLTYFLNALKDAEKKEKENKDNNVKVNYESSQEDLIKRLREQNKKYFLDNSALNKKIETLNTALKTYTDKVDNLSEENKMLILENQKQISEIDRLVKENKFAPYDSSRVAHCGDHPFGSPVDLRRLEPSLIKRDTVTVDRQQVIEGLFQ